MKMCPTGSRTEERGQSERASQGPRARRARAEGGRLSKSARWRCGGGKKGGRERVERVEKKKKEGCGSSLARRLKGCCTRSLIFLHWVFTSTVKDLMPDAQSTGAGFWRLGRCSGCTLSTHLHTNGLHAFTRKATHLCIRKESERGPHRRTQVACLSLVGYSVVFCICHSVAFRTRRPGLSD